MKKTITCLFLSVLMVLSPTMVSASINAPERTSNTTWVEDYANVLSPQTEAYIQEYSQRLADEHSACIMVVTVDFVTGTMADYTLAVFNQWKLGDGTLNNGVLLMLSIGDDDYYMMIGRGLEKSFPIHDIQELLDTYLEPGFANKNYDAGVRSVFEHTYNYLLDNIYGWGDNNGGGGGGGSSSSRSSIEAIIGIATMILVFIMIIFIIRAIGRSRRYYEPTYYYTRPRTTTYRSPYSYRPSVRRTYTNYYGPSSSSNYRSSGGGGSSSYHSSGGGGSSSSRSSGSGSSYGGSSRGAGAGRSK